ncbi:MAG: hypothetical protein JWM21_3447 [Acidobacteria bacterium]|nr:hypothetical protein [Acidobacteriota bacterium]
MTQKADRRVLVPVAGVAREIGFYLAGMDEVREQLHASVSGISNEDIGRLAVPETHSIGALVLHIGEAEWWWMQCIVAGHKLTDEDRRAAYWDVLTEPERVATSGYSAHFCLAEADRIRKQTRDLLASFAEADLDRVYARERRGTVREQSLRWILHHLIDHEAQHKGQILMLRRLLGLKNEELLG